MTKVFILLMKPSLMPLGLELQTMEEVLKSLSWQCIGQGKSEDFIKCEIKGGAFYSLETGEKLEPGKGCFTDAAWQEFNDNLPLRRSVKVTFDDGDIIETEINGTIADVKAYYAIGKKFNIGNVEDNMQRITNLEFI